MQKPWLTHYPPGVPAEIDPARYKSLVDIFEGSFARFGSRQAAICMGKPITYADLDEASRAFAGFLQSRGLSRGARVSLIMPNVLAMSSRPA